MRPAMHDKAWRYQNNFPGHSHAECANRRTRDAKVEKYERASEVYSGSFIHFRQACRDDAGWLRDQPSLEKASEW